MSHTAPVDLDPIHAAVSAESETRHIVGDDDGERLMRAIVDGDDDDNNNYAPAASIASVSATTTTPSLADVPYQFLRIEVDHDGQPTTTSPAHTTCRRGHRHGYVCDCADQDADPGERCGLLSAYFTTTTVQPDNLGKWHHPSHPRAFADGFPASPDNFDCKQLVSDLRDVNGLLDCDTTRWVLWAGLARARPVDAAADGGPVFAARRRILAVKDLLELLSDVREGLVNRGEATPTVCFIVAVAYHYPMIRSTGGMMLPTSLVEAIQRVTSKMTKKELDMLYRSRSYERREYWGSSSDCGSNCSDCGSDCSCEEGEEVVVCDEEEDYYDYDDDSDSDSEWERDYPPTAVVHYNDPGVGNDHDPGAAAGNHHGPLVRYDTTGRPYYVYYANGDDYARAVKENYREFKARCRVPLYGTSGGQASHDAHAEASSSAGTDTPDDDDSASTSSDGGEGEGEGDVEVEEKDEDSPPTSILETLDTNAAKGDAVEGDLHAVLPEAPSPTDAQWRACCALLCLAPDEHKDAQARSIRIPGTDNMWVTPSQLWTAYWMLASRLDRDLCGGVLADVMGTGKTYVVLAVCLLRAYIAYNRAEVEREWQLGEGGKKTKTAVAAAPKQHLPRNTTTTPGEAVPSTTCPCNNAMGIECYANPGGITRRLAARLSRGAALILAPPTVLDNWVKTIKAVRLQAKYYEPVVFSAKMTKEDVVLAPAPRLKQRLQMQVRPQPHVSSDGLFPAAWQPNVLDVAHAYTPSLAKDAYPERFLLLATHTPDKLTEFFQLPVPLRRSKAGGAGGTNNPATRERKTVYGCPVGIQLVDEFHKAKADVIALARQHKHIQNNQTSNPNAAGNDNFDFWAITGTPLPAKLTDLETVTDIVQRLPAWDDPASRHHGSRVVELHRLQEAYDRAVAADGTPEHVAAFRARADRFFQGGLVTRHTEASTFFGRRIFNLQDVRPQVVVHRTPALLRDNVAKVVARVGAKVREAMAAESANFINWDQAVRSSTLFNHMMDLEILATFPGAAPLMLADPPVIDFGLAAMRAEIRKADDHDVAKVGLFQEHLDTVIEGSPHLATIIATLDAMARDRQKRRAPPPPPTASPSQTLATATATADTHARSALPKKRVDPAMKKLVVLCPRMGEAVFVYLALRKLRPAFRPVFLHADLKLAERTALLHDFNRLDAPAPTAGGVIQCARVLVGTFRDAGTGNDLAVANYQILTGPLRLRSQQDQAFGRTNRAGQTLPLHHTLLVTADSPVDRLVMVAQARRRIVSDPFDMDEELAVAEVEAGDD